MLINFFLILIILSLIFYINKKKIRKFLSKNNIKSYNIDDLDDSFVPQKKDTLLCPTDNSVVNFFCIPSNFNVVGMTSDFEAWILAVFSKKSKKIFEFGICSGKTSLILSMNSPDNAEIDTITLDEKSVEKLNLDSKDNKIAKRNIISESKYKKFMFSGTVYEKKINVIFQDSQLLDISQMKNKYDLIFIDGGHTYSCIKNDTEKSLEMIKEDGIILWHDFSIGKKSHYDVFKYLNELSFKIDIRHIKNTTLCYFKNKGRDGRVV